MEPLIILIWRWWWPGNLEAVARWHKECSALRRLASISLTKNMDTIFTIYSIFHCPNPDMIMGHYKTWDSYSQIPIVRAYISREILSRCTFGETNFLLIPLISFIWCPIPILMPFSCSLGSICIIEFHFQIKIQKMILIKNLFLQTCTVRVSLLKCRL